MVVAGGGGGDVRDAERNIQSFIWRDGTMFTKVGGVCGWGGARGLGEGACQKVGGGVCVDTERGGVEGDHARTGLMAVGRVHGREG